MEANTCCLCEQPYYRMDALSGTPRRHVVVPVGESSRPYRLWPCGHGAHKLCLAAQGEGGTSMNGPCKVCGSRPCAPDRSATKPNLVHVPQCSVPLTPPARRTQAEYPMKTDDNDPKLEEDPEETKQNANHGDKAAPKKRPRLNDYAPKKKKTPPWRLPRTNE